MKTHNFISKRGDETRFTSEEEAEEYERAYIEEMTITHLIESNRPVEGAWNAAVDRGSRCYTPGKKDYGDWPISFGVIERNPRSAQRVKES